MVFHQVPRLFAVLSAVCTFFSAIGMCFWTLVPDSWGETRIRVRPVATLFEQYTDNVRLSYSEAESDFITMISAGVIAEAKNKNGNLTFSYNLGRSLYSQFSEYDSWRHYSDLSGEYDLSKKTAIQFTNFFRITEDPNAELRERFENIDKVPIIPARRQVYRETIRRDRLRYLSDTAQIKMTHQLSRSDSVYFQYEFEIEENEDPSIQERTAHRPAVGVVYWPVQNRLQIEGDLKYTYEDADNTTIEPGYTDENITVGAVLTYWVQPKIFSLYSGLDYEIGVVNREDALFQEDDNHYETISPSIGFTYDLRPYQLNFDASLSYEKGMTYDNFDLSDKTDDYEDWYGRLEITKRFTDSFQVFFSYAQQSRKFEARSSSNEDYVVYEPTVGFLYLIAPNLPFSFSIGASHREKDASGSDTGVLVNGQAGPWQYSKRGMLRFNASSGTTQQDYGGQNLGYGYYYQGNALATYRLTRYLGTDAYALYRRDSFTDNPDPLNTRDDSTRVVGLGITFQPGKWWYIRLDAVHTDVEATDESDSYQENQIIMRMLWGPEKPFSLN